MAGHPCIIVFMVHSAPIAALMGQFVARNALKCTDAKSLLSAA